MIIRRFKESDAEVVANIIARNFNEVMAKYHSKNIIEQFKSQNTSEKLKAQWLVQEMYVVEEKDILATGALANFGSLKAPKLVISNFFVIPEKQGTGIGKYLFNFLLQVAKNKKVDKLHVLSSRNGLGFYEKVGFKKNRAGEINEANWMTRNMEE